MASRSGGTMIPHIVESRNYYGKPVNDFELSEEQEIEARVKEEMDKVLSSMQPSSSSSASVRMDTKHLMKGYNNAMEADPANWSTPTIFSSKKTIQVPLSSQKSSSSSSLNGGRYLNVQMDEEDELRAQHEVEEKVKKRAQELFEVMRRDQEANELKRIEEEINLRVTEEARKKAAQLFQEEQMKIAEEERLRQFQREKEEKARQQAAEELVAQQAEAARRIEEEVQQRVEEETRRIKELIVQSMLPSSSQYVQPPPQSQSEMILIPLGRKNNSNNKSLPSIVEHPLEEEQESIACDLWTPFSPVKWPRSRKQLQNSSQGDEKKENNFHNEQLLENTSSSEDKEPHHGISRVVTPSTNTMVSDSPITEMSIPYKSLGSMNLTATDIDQLIAAEVEKRIAARDAAIATAKTAEAVAISEDAVAIAKTAQAVAVSTSHTLHEWKNNELHDGKQQREIIRRNSIGGGDVDPSSRRGRTSPSTYSATTTTTTTTTETNVVIGNVQQLESLLDASSNQRPRSTSMGGDVSVGSPPMFRIQREDSLSDPTIIERSFSSTSSTNKGLPLSLPSPRAKQPFTPERARSAMLAAAQLGPLANATAHLLNGGVRPIGWKAMSSVPDGPSNLEFLDAIFTGQKYSGLQLSSHRVAYTILDTEITNNSECKTAITVAPSTSTSTRVIDCCMVHMTTLKSQITTGDILISVNDWPLINIPSDVMDPGVGHFETVLKLLHLAAPPRRIRFMRSVETTASLSGLSDIPILKLTADDALLMYDGLASEDYHALTLDVNAAASTEQQLMKMPSSQHHPKTGSGGALLPAADNSVSTFDVTDSPISLSAPSSARPSPTLLQPTTNSTAELHHNDVVLAETAIPPPAPPSFDESPMKSTPIVESSSSPSRDTYSEILIDCAASALTTNTGAQGHRMSAISAVHGENTNPIPSEHPSVTLHTASASNGTKLIADGNNVRPKKRVTGFFKAVGRVMGLRRSAKSNHQNNTNNHTTSTSTSASNHNQHDNSHSNYQQQQVDKDRSSLLSCEAGSSTNQQILLAARIEQASAIGREATNEVGGGAGGCHSVGSRSITDHHHHHASLSQAVPPSLSSIQSQVPLQQQQQQQAVAFIHSKSFPNPGSLGLKLLYHNIMHIDGQGIRHSIDCLIVGNHHESSPLASAPSSLSSVGVPQDSTNNNTGTSIRSGDILMDINNTSILAKHESHDQNDETETAAQRFFQQAVTILGKAHLPRTIRFFRLSDPRTVSTGRVFTVLTAVEASILIPHISLMKMMQ